MIKALLIGGVIFMVALVMGCCRAAAAGDKLMAELTESWPEIPRGEREG